jgi:hypothetical protein
VILTRADCVFASRARALRGIGGTRENTSVDVSGIASLLELLFSGAVVLGFGIWQLVSVRREIARDRAAAAKKGDQPDV